MNERIRELAEEANVRPLYSPAYAPRYIFEEEELKTFAELIVRECVIRVEREWIRNGSYTEHSQAVSKAIESIKQHFGVEE